MTVNASHHLDIVAITADAVRRHGAPGALEALRAEQPALHEGAYHDTRAVFMVWAVDRLVRAGLSSTAILWHPLVHEDSVYAWWSAARIDSADAAAHFVASDLALPGEPTPLEPRALIAA